MWSTLDSHCGAESPFWDWSSVWHTDNPDFTTCFQKTVLVWIPCGLLWLYLPIEVCLLKKKRRRRIPWTFLNGMKLFLTICLSLLSAVELFHWVVLWSAYSVDVPPVNYYSNFIKFVSFIAVSVLIAFHRLYGIRSSGFLFSFWIILLITTIISVRSWLMSTLDEDSSSDILLYTICVITVPIVLVQLILSSITDAPPIGSVKHKNACPVNDASLFSRLTFSWFDEMAVLGHKRALTRDDLWLLNDEFRSDHVYPRLQKQWEKTKLENQRSGKKKSSILQAIAKTFLIPFIQVGIIQLLANMCDFATPVMLGYLIDYVSNDEPTWRGYFYCSVLFFIGLTAAILYCYLDWITFRVGLKLRAGMISLIYRKAVRLSSNAKRTSSTGEIVNLISVDSERLHGVYFEIHNCWVSLLQVVIAINMLWQELGPSVLASLAVFAIMLPANAYVSSKFNDVIAKQMKYKDKRIKLMNEILAGIKVLKLYAWEKSFFNQVNGIRNKELKVLKTNEYLVACMEFLYSNIPILLTLVTFVTYVLVDETHILDAKKVFVSISIFNILNYPILLIPMMVVEMVQARVSLKRLNKFFNEEELDPNAVSRDTNAGHSVIIENATLAWDRESDPVLNEINLTCSDGKLVAVLGPVGSGKSSLVSAILGEMEKRRGNINVKGSIAYVAQQAWIQNATLRDNIIFGSTFDQSRYDEVIEACALKPDLLLLPASDQTEIGERGINLSGGQKQRVSLARAVYSNVDMYLLDDPLSAVDAHVGKHIFDNVIGPNGLLKGKTRLFITNGINYLSQTDSIVVLSQGYISEVGTYDQLINNRGAFAGFLQTYLNNQQTESTNVKTERMTSVESNASTAKSVYFETNVNVKAPIRRSLSRSLSQESAVIRHTSHEQLQGSIKQKSATLIEEEEAATGTVSWSIYWNYIRALGLWTVILVVISNVAVTSCDAYSNIWLSIWSQDPPVRNDELRNARLGVYGALGFGQVAFLLIGCLALAAGSIRASREIHNSLLTNVLRLPLSFFDTTPVGRIVNRFSKDIALVDDSIAQNLHPLLATTMEALSVMVVVGMSTPLILTVVAPIVLIYYLVQRFYISTSRQLKRLVFVAHSPVFSQFSETLFGTTTIRAYDRTNDFIRESERLVDEFHTCTFPSLTANRWLGVRLLVIGQLINFFAAFFAVVSRSNIDPGTMGLTVSYAANVVFALIILVRTACELEANIVAIERITEYTTASTEAPYEIENTKPEARWPRNGLIEFKNYSTRYRPGLDLVLDKVNCHIQQQEKIGVVGRTGAGKSSLALALFRIVEPSSGKIIIDGIDTTRLGLGDLRSRLTIIPQDPVLFSGSLRMNLDPFDKYSDAQVWRALEHSHLKSFVSSLPDGLKHTVNEGGENLSVGQRQLVCLARALLRKSKVLVLDEATAAVDLETDEVIQATIRKEFVDCTVITIAHRLNTIMDSTRIMVLDCGRIKEFDAPENLLRDSNSLFYSLAKDAGIVQ